MTTLLLLSHHTPSLVPLELSIIIKQSNDCHPELQKSTLFLDSLDNQQSLNMRPAEYLLERKPDFFSLSNSYNADNSLYLCHILADLGMNQYSIITVCFDLSHNM